MVYNVVAFVYPKYETLDLHGPLEMLGRMDDVKITILAQTPDHETEKEIWLKGTNTI